MNPLSSSSNSVQAVSKRGSYGYYCDANGILQVAQPYEIRPDITYTASSSVLNGFLCENELDTVSSNDSDFMSYYKDVISYHNSSSGGWTVSEETIIGPSGKDTTAFLITVPVNSTTDTWDIPLGNNIYRMPPGGTSPCWSFFIKKNNVPSGISVNMGVPGQSLEPFDFDTMNWSASTLSSISADKSYAWYLWAGREEYSNGWIRMGIGGYCSAGNQIACAAIEISSSSSPSSEFSFYICNINSTYEKTASYMSSYIVPGVTRQSDILTTEEYYTNNTTQESSYIDGNGMLVICPPGTVRPNYTYDSTTKTWSQDGNLSESALVSALIDATSGTMTNTTIVSTTDVLDPTGGTGAYLVSGTKSSYFTYEYSTTLSGPAVFSCFIKKNVSGMSIKLGWNNVNGRVFDFDTMAWTDSDSGSVGYSVAIDTIQLANGWMRIGIGMSDPGDYRTTVPSVTFEADGSFYIYGVNKTVESKVNYMSSYIPSMSGRSADNIVKHESSNYSFNVGSEQTIRNTTATYTDYQGNIQTSQPYNVRPKYTYISSTWSRDGFIVEGESYNYATDDLFTGEWGGNSSPVTIIKDYSTPFGIQNVSQLNLSTNNFMSLMKATLPSWANGLIFSCYMKHISGGTSITSWSSYQNSYPRTTFDISSLVISQNDYSSILEDVGNGWIRFSSALLQNTASTNNTSLNDTDTWYQFINNGSSTTPVVYVCGCMIEPTSGTLNNPTTFIPFSGYRASDT